MKRWLAVTGAIILLFSLAAAAMADNPVRLVVDGKEINADVPPQIINGRTIVPVRWIADAFGATVEWNQDTQTVLITDKERQNLKRRVDLLESALVPKTPEEAAAAWASGVKTRNGAQQYAVMSPDLQKKMLSDFESMYWVTGTSSPWVERFEISPKEILDDGSCKFEILFNLATSTSSAGSHHTDGARRRNMEMGNPATLVNQGCGPFFGI